MQYYQYITTFNDPKWLRYILALVFTLDAAQTGQSYPTSTQTVAFHLPIHRWMLDSDHDILSLGVHRDLFRYVPLLSYVAPK